MNRKNESGLLNTVKSNLFALVFFVLVLVLVLFGIRATKESQREQALASASDSIRRAVVTCYAIEGSYPESYEYIKAHYGVYINEDKYAVFYTVHGANIMPQFWIVERVPG